MRARVILAVIILLATLAVAIATPAARADDPEPSPPPGPAPTATRPAAPTAPATPSPAPTPTVAFQRAWERTDAASVRGTRPYIWGAQPIVPIIEESLLGVNTPRLALYWDKGRMEINDLRAPYDTYYVSTGRLVVEMVLGQQQIGIKPDRFAERAPAQIPFGDRDDPTGPTYASFAGVLGAAPLAVGAPVAQGIDRAGTVSAADAGGVTCASVVAQTKHCIAAPFQDFLNQTGPLLDRTRITTGKVFDPTFYLTGLPITEPYWITVQSGGKPTRVLIQLFERRVLTYNPANPAPARVEMGNVGLAYYHWRYDAVVPSDPPSGLDPFMRQVTTLVYESQPSFRPLIANLAGGNYQLLFQDLSLAGAYGATVPRYKVIVLDNSFLKLDPRDAAGVMAHEAQHAYDFSTIGVPVTANECYALELRAFLVGAAYWQAVYGPNGKPNPQNTFELRENAILLEFRQNPTRFVAQLQEFYAEQCAPLGPGSPDRFLTLANMPAGIEAQLPVVEAFAALRGPVLGGSPGRSVRSAYPPLANGTILGEIPLIDRGSREFMVP